VTFFKSMMSLSRSRRKASSIATLFGDVTPFMFSVAILIEDIVHTARVWLGYFGRSWLYFVFFWVARL